MKYISLDIETTGLHKGNCQVLQIAAVVDNFLSPIAELPRFAAFVNHENLQFEPYALNLHMKTGLLQRYLDDKAKVDFTWVIKNLVDFLNVHYPLAEKEKYNVAGKNLAGFDLPFLAAQNSNTMTPSGGLMAFNHGNAVNWQFLNKINHRVIDPGTSFTNFGSDKGVVSLDTCKERAKVFTKAVTHDALDDALDVVAVVRKIAEHNKVLLDSYMEVLE